MIKNFFNVAGADAVKRIAEWIRHKFYTKTEIDDMLSAGMRYEVVEELPATGEAGTVYLVPKQSAGTGDVYDEYIYVDGSFEHIGSTEIDLSNYYTKTQADNLLDGKQASVTITTNANTPTDNDTFIMQDSGNTGTTSFLRRKLSTLWNYIKGKDGYPEARLAWGGKHLTNATSPVDAALIPDLSANRAAFINPNCVDILYSEDGGTTWQDYGLTDWDKQRLLCDERSVIVGKRSSSQHADAQCMLRILIHDTTSYFYVKIQKIAVYCATNGSEGCYCNVTGRKQVNINNNVDSWDTLADHVSMDGWSGWNIIQTSFITYGGNTTSYHINNYYGQIRLDFGISGPTTADNGAGLSISRIRMYGTECWGGSMSYLAKYGNPFVLREGKKCVFEGPIAVKDGTANQVLLANGDVMGLPVPINKGGTGQTTAQNACNAFINALSTGTSTPTDSDYYVCQYAGGGTTTKTYHRRPMSALWTWIKTHFDSSPTSGSSNGITSGGVYSVLEEKVNLQPDFTASQIDYSAGNVGKWQKVLRFPEGADLVINMKKTAMGSDSTSTLWFSSSSMGDSYTSLFGNHSVRFVHDGGYVFLVLACRKSTYEPIESYTFQIAHSSVPMSGIVAVTDASPIMATPNEPSIIYRAPMTTGAVSFNVTNGAGSVNMSGHNDFLGNMTSEASNGVTVTMSGATEGQIYRFVFTRNITGGVTFKQSNVAYCTISGDVNAGDTITLTAVSNTADGWLYEQESAGIESSDGSNIIEYNGSTADVRVNWEKLPARVVMNVADDDYEDDKNIAIGYGASTYKLTGDENYPYAYTTKATFEKMKVDGGAEEYTHAVTAGTTYSIARGSVTTSFTPAHSGYAVILNLQSTAQLITKFQSQVYSGNSSSSAMLYDKAISGTEQYAIVVMNLNSTIADSLSSNSYASVFYQSSTKEYSVAVGYNAQASGRSSSAIGRSALAVGVTSTSAGLEAKAIGDYSAAIGCYSKASGTSSVSIGGSSSADAQNAVAIGGGATANGYYSMALGPQSKAANSDAVSIGSLSKALTQNAVAVGSSACAEGYCSTSVGSQSKAGLSSTDADRPYRRVKNFTAVQFTDGGDSVRAKQCETDDAVTIAVNGNNYTLTPPDEGYTLVVLNDANAQYINGIVTGYLKINGAFGYYISNTQAVSTEVLSGNYCAVWLKTFTLPSEIASLAFVAYYTTTSAGQYQTANGFNSEAVGNSSVAVGHYITATRDYQVVIGSGNLPDYDALFIIGAGGNVANAKKNILTVDYREQLQVKGVRTQVARMTTSGTIISGVNNIYLISSGCTVGLPSTGEEGQVLKVCAEGNCTVGGVALEAGKFREYVCAGGTWYTRE